MKIVLIASLLCIAGLSGRAQYGRLEPLRERDTVFSVLRTPKETIAKLQSNPDKNVKKQAEIIERLERQLEFVRSGYIINRIPTMNVAQFTNNVKWLESQGINVQYYVEEFFIYFPRQGQAKDRTGKAY